MRLNPDKLKGLLKAKRFSIEALAKKLGLTRGGLYDVMKRDYVKPEIIHQIAQELKVDASEFTTPETLTNVQENVNYTKFSTEIKNLINSYKEIIRQKDNTIEALKGVAEDYKSLASILNQQIIELKSKKKTGT